VPSDGAETTDEDSRPFFQGAARKIPVPAEWQKRDLGEPVILVSGGIEIRAATVRLVQVIVSGYEGNVSERRVTRAKGQNVIHINK
jgi:hypothetical protein